jgi:2-polyprenyl-3-methyl-5-hydroxy-6-metoxy-1,4-benzoquinol methylase
MNSFSSIRNKKLINSLNPFLWIRPLILYTLEVRGIPHPVWLFESPFKIYEFRKLFHGAKISGCQDILDFGCGMGIQSFEMARANHRIVGIDTNRSQIEKAMLYSNNKKHWNTKFLNQGIDVANFASESFDHVFSFCVIEHILNIDDVMSEMLRILKPGGMIHVSVDSLKTIDDDELIERHKLKHKVVRYYDMQELKTIIKKHQFEVAEIFPIFKGDYSKKVFIERNNSLQSYGVLRSNLIANKIEREDKCIIQDKGIFLIARAQKKW